MTLRLLPIALASTLLAAPAVAADCYRMSGVEEFSYNDGAFTRSGQRWELTAGGGAVTLQGTQRASIERERGPSELGWSAPPEVWCAGDPVMLEAWFAGAQGGLQYDGWPVASVVGEATAPVLLATAPGSERFFHQGEPKDLTGQLRAAPRGGAAFALIVRVDMGNGQWVGVKFDYERDETATASGAPVPPPPRTSPQSQPPAMQGSSADAEDVDDEDDGKKKRSYLGDVNAGWFHLGGGFGLAINETILGQPVVPGGRFQLGVGGYTFMLYGGGGMDMDFRPGTPFRVGGHGYVGVALPLPVFHPMFGFKGGGGVGFVDDGFGTLSPAPHFKLGGQAGFIIRKFDGKPGFRLMVEGDYVETSIPGLGSGVDFELWVVFAGVG